jgi:hypothetical protein
VLSVRAVCEQFGKRFGKTPRFVGIEKPDALLSNGSLGHRMYGVPTVTPDQMIAWIADWISSGGATLNKPTHFETRDGKF